MPLAGAAKSGRLLPLAGLPTGLYAIRCHAIRGCARRPVRRVLNDVALAGLQAQLVPRVKVRMQVDVDVLRATWWLLLTSQNAMVATIVEVME
jgi:hypothetical protein